MYLCIKCSERHSTLSAKLWKDNWIYDEHGQQMVLHVFLSVRFKPVKSRKMVRRLQLKATYMHVLLLNFVCKGRRRRVNNGLFSTSLGWFCAGAGLLLLAEITKEKTGRGHSYMCFQKSVNSLNDERSFRLILCKLRTTFTVSYWSHSESTCHGIFWILFRNSAIISTNVNRFSDDQNVLNVSRNILSCKQLNIVYYVRKVHLFKTEIHC